MTEKAVVVDDNGSSLMLETDLLEDAGFEVFEAGNAADGLAAVRRERPDIIIMDVWLPDMRGTEAARILRQDEATRDIPIVFVTASGIAGELPEVNTITNSRLIGKPIDTRTFVSEIRRCIK